MTTGGKERIIESWDFPPIELIELKRRDRDEALRDMDDPDAQQPVIERRYEDFLDRMLADPSGATSS